MKELTSEKDRQDYWDRFIEEARKKAAPDPRAAQNAANAHKKGKRDADPV